MKFSATQEINDLIPFLKQWQHLIGMTANAEFFVAIRPPALYAGCPRGLPVQLSTHHQYHGANGIGRCAINGLMELNGFQAQDFAQIHLRKFKKLHLKVIDFIDSNSKVSKDLTLKEIPMKSEND